jgi:hypothetical protein
LSKDTYPNLRKVEIDISYYDVNAEAFVEKWVARMSAHNPGMARDVRPELLEDLPED